MENTTQRPCEPLNINNVLYKGMPKPSNLVRTTDVGTTAHYVPRREKEDTLSLYAASGDCKFWRTNFESIVRRCKRVHDKDLKNGKNTHLYSLEGDTWMTTYSSIAKYEKIFHIKDEIDVVQYFDKVDFCAPERLNMFLLNRWRSNYDDLKRYLGLRLRGYDVHVYAYPLAVGYAWSQVQLGPRTLQMLKTDGDMLEFTTGSYFVRDHKHLMQ